MLTQWANRVVKKNHHQKYNYKENKMANAIPVHVKEVEEDKKKVVKPIVKPVGKPCSTHDAVRVDS